MFGVYGACSTMGESISIASMLVDGGFADNILAITSSHFASAESSSDFHSDMETRKAGGDMDGDRKRCGSSCFKENG